MTVAEYEALTGETATSKTESQIERTKEILRLMLGYWFDECENNEYEEIGKTKTDCPCDLDIDLDNLDDPDEVEVAYKYFFYNDKDLYMRINPCTAVHKVKLVKEGITLKTFDTEDYRVHKTMGMIRFIENLLINTECFGTQLAVDATWLCDIPDEINQVWGEMITWYSDPKKDIKSQTLGTHSYTKAELIPPELRDHNLEVIKKYAGPNGTLTLPV